MKPKAIIVDLDGTLANCEHRRHHLEKKNWTMFFAGMGEDPINQWVLDVVCAVMKHHGYALLLVTGRPADYSQLTMDWIDSHPIPANHLYMRKPGDFRGDEIIKRELYEQLIEPKWDVQLVIDDRDKVVKMWRSLGLNVLQCNEGAF